ncbi:MAG: 23S rRNA (guanosine(2251)-2'-O)-methyltransferase RlmB, partial [Proteobacteria bacterium]|nr:23S rRNA (guanosine(2251)-2'-O)-methyltransferase RlmB [Pseudomonadota bacterium]
RERCDAAARLPMAGGGGSLNVSVAAAIALYEFIRGHDMDAPEPALSGR